MLEEGAHDAGESGRAQLRHNLGSLNAMLAFADEVCVCRRVLLMRHFGEEFNAAACNGAPSSPSPLSQWRRAVKGSCKGLRCRRAVMRLNRTSCSFHPRHKALHCVTTRDGCVMSARVGGANLLRDPVVCLVWRGPATETTATDAH
jgi:superfamily II DNA helicase RecQ